MRSTHRPHFTPGKEPVPILQEAGWIPGPLWTGGISPPHWDSTPDRPTRSQSRYRLSYRVQNGCNITNWKRRSKTELTGRQAKVSFGKYCYRRRRRKGPNFFYFNVTLCPVLSSAFGYSNTIRSNLQHSDIPTNCPVQSPSSRYRNIVRSIPQHSDILTLTGPISSLRIFRHICPVQSPTFGYSNIVRSNFQPTDIPTYMSGTLGTFLVRLPCYVTSRAPSSCSRIPRQPAPQPAAHDTHHNPHTPASST
jgi:hypothetical protein